MAKAEEEKPDGLEIISIGKLYNGPWDKKYWSCSRGKDRYPYPIGYQARRSHRGLTYKVEVHEGLKGPLFMISSDGQSYSGHTPDIAWENIQKKGFPRTKFWHGKRHSCKVDGVEFFGLKNALVQRLLRELVANVNGNVGHSTYAECHTQHRESCIHPDLLPYLVKPQVTGKRSKKKKITGLNSISEASRLKRLRCQEASYSNREIQSSHPNENSLNSSKVGGLCRKFDNSGILLQSGNLNTIAEEENNTSCVKDGLCSDSLDFSDNLKKEVLPQEEINLNSSKRHLATREVDNLFRNKEMFIGQKLQRENSLSFSKSVDRNEGEISIGNNPETINNEDIFAPDTLDLQLDDPSNSTLNNYRGSPNNLKAELISIKTFVPEVLVSESKPEPESQCTLNASSEKSDFDSAGEELTKSMMIVLLPRALPLLKTFSRKKKACKKFSNISTSKNESEIDLHSVRPQEEVAGTDLCRVPPTSLTTAAGMLAEDFHMRSPDEIMHAANGGLSSVLPDCGHIASIVPDSFDSDQCENSASKQQLLISNIETDQNTFHHDSCIQTKVLPLGVNAWLGSSFYPVDRNNSKTSFLCKVQLAEIKGPQEGDNLVYDSALSLTLNSGKEFSTNSDEENTPLDTHSMKNGIRTLSVCREEISNTNVVKNTEDFAHISDKGNLVQTEGAGIDTAHFTRIPKVAGSIEDCNNTSAETIICRNSRDLCAPGTFTVTKISPVSDICLASYASDGPVKQALFGDEVRPKEQLNSFHNEKYSVNHEGALCNMTHLKLQDQEFVRSLNFVNTRVFLDPSTCIEKSQGHVDKDLQGHEGHVESNTTPCWQNQGASFCDGLTEKKETKKGLNLNSQTNTKKSTGLHGILELVGCYVHPVPVLLVLLSSRGNAIYICVLCGDSADKNRTLFIYKAQIEGEVIGHPSFIGHAPLQLSASKETLGREIASDSSCLQLTPDGQLLVLLNSIRAPFCREGNLQCPCSSCTSDSLDNNAVKIVRPKLGYVSLVSKLNTIDRILCILVCEPYHIVAAEESGRLHLWLMSSDWSAWTEESFLPTFGSASLCVELKRIPRCASLILGHNGFGEFTLWDISKKILMSRFSTPETSVIQFFPVSLLRWQRERTVFSDPKHINEIMDSTRMWFSNEGPNHSMIPTEGEDVAIWLLIYTALDLDFQHGYQLNVCKSVGCWRLGLLAKNMVIHGSSLDERAAAVGSSGGHGIVGTYDGRVYMWELSTGTKLGTVHNFEGAAVSCIASTDELSPGVLAIAADCQLMVYWHSQNAFPNQH